MFERILVALDGSPQAEVALPYVEDMAGRLRSEVTLLQVCESQTECSSAGRKDYLERIATSIKAGVQKQNAAGGQAAGREFRVRTTLVAGNPAENIVDYASKNDTGLIVLAARGRSSTSRWPLGSVADKVVRATKVPVALIGGAPRSGQVMFRKALLPLDGSTVGEAALPYAEELALKLGTELLLLQVLEFKYITYGAEAGGYVPYPQDWVDASEQAARQYLSAIEERLKAKGINASSRVESGAAADSIIQVAEQVDADFIAMSTHGRSGVGRWVFGSVADRVVHYGKFPVLVVRASQGSAK